jgi:WD40 repeat protein
MRSAFSFSRMTMCLPQVSLLISLLCGCSGLAPSQGPQLRLEEVHPFGATRIAFSPSGTRLASGGLMGEVQVWSVPSGERLAGLSAHDGAIRGLLWLDNQHLLNASSRGQILVWDPSSQAITASLRTDRISAAAFLPSPARLYIGYSAGRVRSFGYPGFEQHSEVDLASTVLSIAVQPTRQWLAVSSAEGSVQLFDSRLRLVRKLQTPPGKVRELRFSPDGEQLAGGGWFSIYLWSTETGELHIRETEHIGAVVSLDYSPDGEHLASMGRYTDSSLRVTDVANGSVRRRLSPHPLCGWNVRFSPDGRMVGSSSEDGSIHLYDVTIPYQPSRYHQ